MGTEKRLETIKLLNTEQKLAFPPSVCLTLDSAQTCSQGVGGLLFSPFFKAEGTGRSLCSKPAVQSVWILRTAKASQTLER